MSVPQQYRTGPRAPGGPGQDRRDDPRYNGYSYGNGNGNGFAPPERRPGGYGGFDNGPLPRSNYPPAPYASRERGPQSDRVNGRYNTDGEIYRGGREEQSRPRDRSRPPAVAPAVAHGNSQGGRQIEDALQTIQKEWDFMTKSDCVPVQVALQLMDSSSLGRAQQYEEFKQAHEQLQRALKTIVNEHYEDFNSLISTFYRLQATIQASQIKVRKLKDSLIQAKSHLLHTKPELKVLASSSQSYDDMLQLLSQIEELQLMPEKLEARISEKRFLSAVEVLQDALRMIRQPELQSIGALSDLRIYLSNQETSVPDILIEELHSHLYLRSPYCQDRWKQHVHDQGILGVVDGNPESVGLFGNNTVHKYLETTDMSRQMTEDSTRNPEADTFSYIRLLIEALNNMGHLETAVNQIEQRLPVELFRVVEKTNNEVDQRHPSVVRNLQSQSSNKWDYSPAPDDAVAATILDLLWSLYSKFEAIAEGHRVVHDVIIGIIERQGIQKASSLTSGFSELWKLYQSEMRSLLHDYLAATGNITYRYGRTANGDANVFQRTQRDRNRKLFKLADVHSASGEGGEDEDLDAILKPSVPGLVSNLRSPLPSSMTEHNHAHDVSATGHKLLIEPSVFNVGFLLPPSLSFIQRLKNIVPAESEIVMSTLTSFLDDFLVNVFHPQLDETISELSAQVLTAPDAFQEEHQWQHHSRKPLFKGTHAFSNMIRAFCRMLDSIPHDQAFSNLLLIQIKSYHDKCYNWFKTLVTRAHVEGDNGVRLKAAAAFAESQEFRTIAAKLLKSEGEQDEGLLQEFTNLLVRRTTERQLQPSDIISDHKTVPSLGLLYISMKWLAIQLKLLRRITDHGVDTSRGETGRHHRARRWTMVGSTKPRSGHQDIYLPITEQSAGEFDKIVNSFEELATTALLTLYIDVRCGVVHNLETALQGSYILEQSVTDPGPEILTVNSDINKFDESIMKLVPERAHKILTTGLGLLVDEVLIQRCALIRSMNLNGCGRMQVNILVLQQNLKNIEGDVRLSRSAHFYELFAAGADAIVSTAKEKGAEGMGFSYDELKDLVQLCYAEALSSDRREVATQAKRGLNDCLLQLSEYLWQT